MALINWEDLIENLNKKFKETMLALSLATNVWLALSLKESWEKRISDKDVANDKKERAIEVLGTAIEILQTENAKKWQRQIDTLR